MVHLHIKTEYSLLSSAARIEDIPKAAAALGQTAAAITDSGVLYGAPQFFRAAQKCGIKPIIGLEMKGAGIVLLAKNAVGYKNLCIIASDERQKRNAVKGNGAGLIALSGGMNSEIMKLLADGAYNEAKRIVNEIAREFDAFYIEITNHSLPVESAILPLILKLSAETGCPLCASNDVYYTAKNDAETREMLLRIKTGTILTSKDSESLSSNEFYIKSEAEMLALFGEHPEAVYITDEIAEQCSFNFADLEGGIHLPAFPVPNGLSSARYLTALSERGAMKRYGESLTEDIKNRLAFELSVIDKMGFNDYFLIVWDFIKFAKSSGIPVGPGRGSGAGSLVAYSIGITGVDPIRYGLLFERFLNPERVSLPDFDIDFGDERRDEVKEYVKNRYGTDKTAGIITFGTLAAKNAVRDVVRIMGMPMSAGDYLSKRIPMNGKLSMFYQNGKCTETDPAIVKIITAASKIEGYPKNASTHAAGLVIADKPLTEYLPVISTAGALTTQFAMGDLEPLGLVKMDFLGLKTLTVIDDTVKAVRLRFPDFSEEHIKTDDKAVFEMLSRGETAGVFQFESEGITSLIMRMRPQNIEDIIAAVSLYRPGPMEKIPEYLENRKNPSKIKYLHPVLRDILKETYGVAIYQEQVMKIAREMAGFSYGRADLLRRAMSKKKLDIMEKEKSAFLDGAEANGVSRGIAETVFADIEKFAGYAFNKSHAAAYAYISYRTAFLKAHFPTEFFAAILTSVSYSTEKIVFYKNEMKKRGIRLLPPDIKRSERKFTAEGNNAVRFGLSAVKGIGDRAADEIVRIRSENSIDSFESFCKKTDLNKLSKKSLESLVLSGAFDIFGKARKQIMRYLPLYLDAAIEANYKNIAGQTDFFSMSKSKENPKNEEKTIPEYSKEELRNFEIEYCGITFDGS
jgi:DNA polymerase-3 subunit alpha